MAFDKPDTDTIYDRVIEPTLKEHSIKAVRVDRIEHNDDIDDKILEQLRECSFVLADLTYARPSVYFEAGYAQRRVNVIYTVRKDHFRPKDDDEFGNFRVHFDLQMKNIIGGKDASDKSFPKRLSRRLRYVIRPLLKGQERLEQNRKDALQFSALSPHDRLRAIRETITATLARYSTLRAKNDRRLPGSWEGYRLSNGKIFCVSFFLLPENTKQAWASIAYRWSQLPGEISQSQLPMERLVREAEKTKRRLVPKIAIVHDIFICADAAISRSSVSSRFPSYAYHRQHRWFFGKDYVRIHWRLGGLFSTVRLHVLDKIASTSELQRDIRARLAAIGAAKES